jgi:tetratricopeptide (TPR) repeat protein
MGQSRSAAAQNLLRQGWAAFQQGRWSEARQALEEVLALDPRHADALRLLAETHARSGDREAAAAALESLLQDQPAQPAVWCRLGELKEDQGQLADAVACLAKATALEGDHVQAHYNLARLLRQLGRRDEALSCLQQALQAGKAAPTLLAQILQLRALLEEEADALLEALDTLNQALAAAPKRAALHHNRAVVLQRLSRPEAALQAHDQAQRLGLDAPDAHYNRGNSLQSLGRLADAAAAYRRALALNPGHDLALYDLARLRWRRGDANFMQELDDVRLNAAEPAARATAAGIQGRLLLRAERFEEAAQAYGQAVAAAPAVAGYLDGWAQSLARLSRFAQAREVHHRAVALAPAQAAVHISLASTLLQAGDPEQAVLSAQRAVDCNPLDQQAWALLGLAWQSTQDPRAGWLMDVERLVQVYDLHAPASGEEDGADFNRALALVLEQMHTDAQAPIDQTLRQGTQSLGNIFEQAHPLLDRLRALMAAAMDRHLSYLQSLPGDAAHPLLGRLDTGWRFTDSWSSRLRSSGFHVPHVHPHGWISSCYYVALPPVVQTSGEDGAGRPGWLHFGMPDISVPGIEALPTRMVRPEVGRLVLFPSYLWHGTVPFNGDGARLTVAFDVEPGKR